jgi:hypothetical protein
VEVEEDITGCQTAADEEAHSDEEKGEVFGESIDDGPGAEGDPSPLGPLDW